jgi:hypothetical protein
MVGLAIGALIGAATGAVASYIFGPAQNTTFDENYHSRVDWALEEGERAAAEREAELRLHFSRLKAGEVRSLPPPPQA